MSIIKKDHIATGIIWIEIPDADLRICCGVPPDTVKFLRKKGYIKTNTGDGAQSGPNALLLSDAFIQNHMLCNLGEFPVMQMLYMQGMLNDTTKKPMIIGLEEVVHRQMEYIKRGNYGHYSIEEIAHSHNYKDLSPAMIHAMKHYFANGVFHDTTTLCQAIPLHNYEKEHIINDVYISRTGFNKFEIAYQSEIVEVDLNLPHGSQYELPYSLPNSSFRYNSFSVLHAGEGNGWHPDQPCMGSVLNNNEKLYCIDCGPNAVNNLLKLGIDIQDLEGLFLTHIHDDHFAGLADILKTTDKLKLYTTPLIRSTVEKKFSALLGLGPKVLYDFLEVVNLEFDKWNAIDDFEVKPVFSPHPVETNILMFRKLHGDKYLNYSHLADTIALREIELIRQSSYYEPSFEKVFDNIKSVYLEYADLKKVDIGGGKIHGEYHDFDNDSSFKTVYSHIDQPFYKEDNKTYDRSNFGQQDILIEDDEPGYLEQILSNAISSLFPVSTDEKLIKKTIRQGVFQKLYFGETYDSDDIVIVLSGCLGAHHVRFGKRIIYNRGNFIGLLDSESDSSQHLKALSSFVNIFSIGRSVFYDLFHNTTTYEFIVGNKDVLQQLAYSEIFSRGFNTTMLVEIGKVVERFTTNEEITLNERDLEDVFIVIEGSIHAVDHDKIVMTFGAGDAFGGHQMLDGSVMKYAIRMSKPSTLLRISAEHAKKYPLIAWQLFENCALHNHLCNIGIYKNG